MDLHLFAKRRETVGNGLAVLVLGVLGQPE